MTTLPPCPQPLQQVPDTLYPPEALYFADRVPAHDPSVNRARALRLFVSRDPADRAEREALIESYSASRRVDREARQGTALSWTLTMLLLAVAACALLAFASWQLPAAWGFLRGLGVALGAGFGGVCLWVGGRVSRWIGGGE